MLTQGEVSSQPIYTAHLPRLNSTNIYSSLHHLICEAVATYIGSLNLNILIKISKSH